MKVIVTGNLNNSISKIRNIAKLKERSKDFCEKLVEIGTEVASIKFSCAIYDGNKDANVDKPYWEGDTLILSASGTTVLFIEFGSGVYQPPYPKTVEGIVARGTFGYGLGKLRSWHYWGNPGDNGVVETQGQYKGMVRTKGNPPASAMYNASIEMRRAIEEVAKEVFKL